MPGNNNFLTEIETLLNGALGYPKGTLALRDILDRNGGGSMYIPTATEIYIEWRNRQIMDRFTGGNHEEIARDFKLSTSQVRRIVDGR